MNIKVWPKNDQVRKLLKHPSGVGFRETGSAVWPDDAYTYRRLKDGDLVLTEPSQSTRPQPRQQPSPPSSENKDTGHRG